MRIDVSDAPKRRPGPERGDEWVDLELGDDEPIDRATRPADQNDHQRRAPQPNWVRHARIDTRSKRKDGADRKVEPAADHHKGHANRNDADRRVLAEDIG